MSGYRFEQVNLKENGLLSYLDRFLTEPVCNVFVPEAMEGFNRTDCDGLVMLVGAVGYRQVGVIFSDFRVNGGSFGSANSLRATAFLELMEASGIPVVFMLNTLGVRFMEGRTVFKDTFSLIPQLAKFASKNLLVTISTGRTLGIGAIIFGMGHYRIAVRDESLINLTGPEVINLFFGQGFDFKAVAAAENQFLENNLVHELADSRDLALVQTRKIISAMTLQTERDLAKTFAPEFEGEHMDPSLLCGSEAKLKEILAQFNGSVSEVFPELSPMVRTYLAVHDHKLVGVFINPPGHVGNMVNTRALEKYATALDFFKTLNLPILSFVDTAGAEPRTIDRERDLLGQFINVAKKIIEYPHPKMGFVIGRCFGGATVLVFPKNFGGRYTHAVEGSRIGVMHEDIIAQLLGGSPRLLDKWRETARTQTPDLADLVECGLIDERLVTSEIGLKMSEFIFEIETERLAREAREHGGSEIPFLDISRRIKVGDAV